MYGGQKSICPRMEVHGPGGPPLSVPGWVLWNHWVTVLPLAASPAGG